MKSLVYCEGEFGKIDGKVANGLARHSEKYQILGIIPIRKQNTLHMRLKKVYRVL